MLRRTWLWLRAEAPFVVVVTLVLASCLYLYLAPGHWRRASGVIALALIVAGLFRAFLPNSGAGLLFVRGRARDAVTYLVLGGVILGVAIHLR